MHLHHIRKANEKINLAKVFMKPSVNTNHYGYSGLEEKLCPAWLISTSIRSWLRKKALALKINAFYSGWVFISLTQWIAGKRNLNAPIKLSVGKSVGNFLEWCGRTQSTMGSVVRGPAVLGDTRKQTEQSVGNKPVLSIPSRPLLHFLPLGSCLEFPPWWPSSVNYKP